MLNSVSVDIYFYIVKRTSKNVNFDQIGHLEGGPTGSRGGVRVLKYECSHRIGPDQDI